MKLLITGDWHLTDKTPRNRIDDYPKTQHRKVSWIIGTAIQNQCRYILQPGDMFDSFKARDKIKSQWIERWRNVFYHNRIKVLTVPGQHDMRYHSSDLLDTPMGVLYAADAIKILRPGVSGELGGESVFVYGSGWNESIPEPIDASGCHIWITHRMVIDEPLWEGQTDYEKGNLLLKRTKFDLIVTGDNHQHFAFNDNNERYLINCGSLMRSTIDQITHIPTIYIYDTETRAILPIAVNPIAPIEEVLRVEEAKEEKERNEKLEAFVEGLKEQVELNGLDFKRNITKYLNSHRVKPSVKRIIEEVLGNG
jgi:DNA repair exonuclease SbcCD nuclease subunit